MQSGERITINGQEYRLDTVLSTGAGSYGQVWAATDAAGHAVAIKLINAEAMTQVDPTLHGHWRAHLEREIAFLSGLNAEQSRHVVVLLDHGMVDGQPALVLERLQANLGQWLAQQRREGAPSPDLAQVLDWAEQMIDGLDVVHQAGFVYRDLKFSNLLVGDAGARLKLADFGTLKREDGDNTRSFIGTPATMAPEQVLPVCQGAAGFEYAVDYRADYYALGLLLFALLTDQPTTAAQRRLGQLLALHGQEGVSQQDAQLGGLDDEERERLRCAVAFWTVPARPDADGGIAALLVQLVDRLLARDPADRPTASLEIRAALDAARVHPVAALTLTPDWNVPLPAAEPPNWHPRRPVHAPASPLSSRRRWAVLAGAFGLVGVVAWAIIHPSRQNGPDQAESLSAMIAPPAAVAPAPMPLVPPVPPAPPPTVVESSPTPPPAPVVDVAAPTKAPPADDAQPITTAAPVPAPVTVVAPPPVHVNKPVAHSKPTKPVVAADPPAVVNRPSRTHVRPAEVERPPAAPAVRVAKPTPPRPAPVAVEHPAPVPVARIPKPAPVAVEPPHRPAPPVKVVPAPREKEEPARAVAHAKPAPSPAAHPPQAVVKPAAPVVKPVARIEPPRHSEPHPRPAPALPPLKLEARPEPAPALPPIRLEARPRPTPPAPPPIELVSRASAVSSPRPPTPNVAHTESRPKPSANPSPRPARSTDPISQFREDANRAATALGDLVSRTSTTVGHEVQRGLETADRAVGNWIGHCNQSDGCGRNTTQAERRDRGSRRHSNGTIPARESSPVRNQYDDVGFTPPPPRSQE